MTKKTQNIWKNRENTEKHEPSQRPTLFSSDTCWENVWFLRPPDQTYVFLVLFQVFSSFSRGFFRCGFGLGYWPMPFRVESGENGMNGKKWVLVSTICKKSRTGWWTCDFCLKPCKRIYVMSCGRNADLATPCLCWDISPVVCTKVIRYSPVIKGDNEKPLINIIKYLQMEVLFMGKHQLHINLWWMFHCYVWLEGKHHAVLGLPGLPCTLKYLMEVILGFTRNDGVDVGK